LGFAADPFGEGVLGDGRCQGSPKATGEAGGRRPSFTPDAAENFGCISGRRQGFGAEM